VEVAVGMVDVAAAADPVDSVPAINATSVTAVVTSLVTAPRSKIVATVAMAPAISLRIAPLPQRNRRATTARSRATLLVTVRTPVRSRAMAAARSVIWLATATARTAKTIMTKEKTASPTRDLRSAVVWREKACARNRSSSYCF